MGHNPNLKFLDGTAMYFYWLVSLETTDANYVKCWCPTDIATGRTTPCYMYKMLWEDIYGISYSE